MELESYIKELDKTLLTVKKKLMPRLTKGIDSSLSMSHLYILRHIDCFDDCIVSELADYLGITLSGVTQLVEKLVKMNMVIRERSEKDRRVVYIRITEEGKKILVKLNENRIKAFSDYFSVLTEEEMKLHFKVLEKVTSHALREDEK